MTGWAGQLSSVAPNVENDDDDADSPPLLLSKWLIEGKKGPILSYSRDCDSPPGMVSSKAAGDGRDTARLILHRRCQCTSIYSIEAQSIEGCIRQTIRL